MTEAVIVKALSNIIIVMMVAVFLVNNIETKYSKIVSIIIIFLVVYIPALILNMCISNERGKYNIITNALTIFIGMKLVGKSNIKKYLKNVYIIYIIIFVIEMIAQFYFNIIVSITNYETKDIYGESVVTVLSLAVMGLASIIIVMSYLLLKKKIEKKIKYQILVILIMIPLFNIILLTLLYVYNFPNMQNTLELYSLFCMIISFIVNVTTYEIIVNLEKYYQQEKQIVFLKEKEKMLYDYYKLAIKNEEELRKLKHDMKNELQIAYSLTEDKEGKNKAKYIIDGMKDNIEKIGKIEYCKNAILNALFRIKVAQAQEKKIEFNIKIENEMSMILEDIDICNIFSNLIDNSIKGTQNASNKSIDLEIYNQMGFIVIKIENTYEGKVIRNNKGEILTTKKDDKNHGYGLSIVKSIVQKYNGELKINYQDNRFKITILIPKEKQLERV